MGCGVDRSRSSAAALWRRPAATALIQPLAWEPPYTGAKEKEKRKKKKTHHQYYMDKNLPQTKEKRLGAEDLFPSNNFEIVTSAGQWKT